MLHGKASGKIQVNLPTSTGWHVQKSAFPPCHAFFYSAEVEFASRNFKPAKK
jgi:hypothetical protein